MSGAQPLQKGVDPGTKKNVDTQISFLRNTISRICYVPGSAAHFILPGLFNTGTGPSQLDS